MKRYLYLSTASLALSCSAVHAQTVPDEASSQSAKSDPAASTDIVVTAQKRSERLQDVPLSITAASSSELKSRGVVSTDDLVKLTPGFSAAKSSFGIPIYFIRGVGFVDESIGISPAVMTYVDQIPLDYAPMGRGAILDLERVEILKGPQGTLFGENTTGGAINYIAAKPTDRFEAGVEGTYGRFNDASAEGFISGPLASNLNARLAVQGERSDGWQQGYPADQGYSSTARLGAKRFVNARLLIDWSPTATTKVEFMATGWRDNSDTQAPQLLGVTPNRTGSDANINPYPVSTVPSPPHDNRYAGFDVGGDYRQHNSLYQFALHVDQQLGDEFTLTSLTSYARYRRNSPVDGDGTVYPSERIDVLGDVTTFNQELRVSGKLASFLHLTVGGNYTYNKVLESQNFGPSHYSSDSFGPYSWSSFGLDNNQYVNTYSGFASADIRLASTISAQFGARYTSQKRDFAGCSRDLGQGQMALGFAAIAEALTGQPAVIPPGSCITLDAATLRPTLANIESSLDQHNLSWRANVSWEPSSDIHLYANVTKGYKSGSFPTLPAATGAQLAAVRQESLLAYEVGAKASLFDRRLQVAAAAFYYDYRNKQLVGFRNVFPFGPLTALVNIPKSKIEGVEFNMDVRPIEGLTLSLGGSYLKTKVLTDPQIPTGPIGNVGSFVGDQFPFTSKWQGVADIQYKFALTSNLNAYAGGSITAKSKAPSALYTGAPAVAALEQSINVPGYKVVDLRFGLQSPDQKWNVEFFARNVFNEYYATSAGKYVDYRFLYTGAPPTYGATIRYRFD